MQNSYEEQVKRSCVVAIQDSASLLPQGPMGGAYSVVVAATHTIATRVSTFRISRASRSRSESGGDGSTTSQYGDATKPGAPGAARRGRGRRRRGVAASARRVAPLLRQRLAPRAARAGESVVEGSPSGPVNSVSSQLRPCEQVSVVEAVGRPLCEMLGGTAASVLGATPFGHLLAAGAAVDWGQG